MSLLSDSNDPVQAEETGTAASDAQRGGRGALFAIIAILLVLLAGILWLGRRGLDRIEDRMTTLEDRMAELSTQSNEASEMAQQALERAIESEAAALAAAQGRLAAEAETARAMGDADSARAEAADARNDAARAMAEAARIRKEAEAELNRLENALSQVADTRRTALGLVMNLGEDSLQFDFDKAELRPENRELLSRIAGILLTSNDYTVSVSGHTDNVGGDDYNQTLSEQRAQSVRDYLVEAGISSDILSVEGHGKKQPLVPGDSEEARAKNRRVELGIVNTRIHFGRVRVKKD